MSRIVIIGSGLGGLSCGLMLARNGHNVTVLEKHSQPGGCLQCFTRRGSKFETGMHFIGSAAEGQTLNRLMRMLNLDDVPLSRLDTSAYDIVSLGGERFGFANGREAFIEQMGDRFPSQRDNLAFYCDIIEKIAAASSLHSLAHTRADNVVSTFYQTISINEVLDNIFDNELLKNVLVGNLPLYAAEKNKTPFSQHAFIADFYNQSAWRVVGGSDRIARSLTASIHNLGGEVRTRACATKILCDDTKATGVEVNSSEFVAADVVISDIHPSRLMELLDTRLLRPVFRQRMTSLRNTPGCFSVYLNFKKETVRYLNSNFYSYAGLSPWNCESYTESSWPEGYLYMHFCHEADARFADSGVLLSYMNFSDVARWAGTKSGHRGSEYEDFKRTHAERLMELVDKDFPGLRDSVEAYYTATPLTYLDYTATADGSMYGVAKDITIGTPGRVPHKTRVPNLFLTGQNINSHGMLGVLVGSIVTCAELLSPETISQMIHNT